MVMSFPGKSKAQDRGHRHERLFKDSEHRSSAQPGLRGHRTDAGVPNRVHDRRPGSLPQVILRSQGREHLIKGALLRPAPAPEAQNVDWLAEAPAGLFGPGEVEVQVEGCRKADIMALLMPVPQRAGSTKTSDT